MSDEHLSFDELAELAEGTLARRKAAAARSHLEGCDSCRAQADALEQTVAALHDLGPVTMPADVVARLNRALEGAASAPPGETVVPDLGEVRRRRLAARSWPYAAAASVVAIAIVAVAVATSGRHHAKTTAAGATAHVPLVGTSAPPQLVQTESGQTYTPDSLAALAPQLLGTSSDSSGGAAGGVGSQTLAAPPNPSAKSGAPLPQTGAGVAPAPAQAPVAGTTTNRQFAAASSVPRPLQRYANSQAALLACAAYITDTPGAAPLAVDFARWTNPKAHVHNSASLILLFADPDDPHLLDIYVVAPACDSLSLRDLVQIPRPSS